jgi:uncharacterized phiE125 gp8 family phage protein
MASYQFDSLLDSSLVITVAELKDYLRVDSNADDTMLEAFINAATSQIEARLNRPLRNQRWFYFIDYADLTTGLININKAPVSAVSSIQYYDGTNTLQTLSSSNYFVSLSSNPCKIKVMQLPNIYNRLDAVKITFTAGYSSVSNIPKDIKQALKFMCGHWYENRQDAITGTMTSDMPMSSQFLLEPYRNLVYGW